MPEGQVPPQESRQRSCTWSRHTSRNMAPETLTSKHPASHPHAEHAHPGQDYEEGLHEQVCSHLQKYIHNGSFAYLLFSPFEDLL